MSRHSSAGPVQNPRFFPRSFIVIAALDPKNRLFLVKNGFLWPSKLQYQSLTWQYERPTWQCQTLTLQYESLSW